MTDCLPIDPSAPIDPAWRLWGPYLSSRQWGTVREDYSAHGEAWEAFPHDHARARAYRWGEDGIFGITDEQERLCFSIALWNEADSILKERLFGLTGNEGNHGEDVKELYYYLDNTPTHSYMKALYQYPQRAFPYEDLVNENRQRSRSQPEYELIDTGIFAENRFFDVVVEYAKAAPEDIVIRVSATNHGPDPAPLHVLPHLWFRNSWSWKGNSRKPDLRPAPDSGERARDGRLVRARHASLADYWLSVEGEPRLLFTNNETNNARLWGVASQTPFTKDAINDAVVHGSDGGINPDQTGTKMAAHYRLMLSPGETRSIMLRLSNERYECPLADAREILLVRKEEADQFYARLAGERLSDDERLIQRRALAGLLWSKQFYSFDVMVWQDGDPAGPPPPPEREFGRNSEWRHLNNSDVILMPDTWEYPWYAAWDLAFHTISLALVDPEFAKEQLILLLREWYMHPNGQLPAYEWAFGDVNPPVHAWAAWRVYKIEKRMTGTADRLFLQRAFHKLMINFTWWVNRKDRDGRNVFEGGFLGLDNIGVFDRSQELPTGGHLEQSDATAWMGMYCLNMMTIALELARTDIAYEDVATKFFEHFLYINGAINGVGLTRGESQSLWDDEDGFFYDVLHLPDGQMIPLRVRSLVGLMPLLAIETIESDLTEILPDFSRRLRWFLRNRKDLAELVPSWDDPGVGKRRLLALAHGDRLRAMLRRMLDPNEFLSDFGIRSLSKFHADNPYIFTSNGLNHEVRYDPAESSTGVFGGNSNWRGPIWFPINYLLIESLERFHHFLGDDFIVEYPTGSGQHHDLRYIKNDLSDRLIRLFLPDSRGIRPSLGAAGTVPESSPASDHLLFHEYFHGDTGTGLGASHQTGWTALVAKLLDSQGRSSNDRI